VLVLQYSNHPATGTGRLLDLPLRGGGFRRLLEGVGGYTLRVRLPHYTSCRGNHR